MTAMTPDEISERRAKARRSAIILGLVAFAVLRRASSSSRLRRD